MGSGYIQLYISPEKMSIISFPISSLFRPSPRVAALAPLERAASDANAATTTAGPAVVNPKALGSFTSLVGGYSFKPSEKYAQVKLEHVLK